MSETAVNTQTAIHEREEFVYMGTDSVDIACQATASQGPETDLLSYKRPCMKSHRESI
jgi:hypothetical protein